jgi:protein-tyrosine-phosphatase
VADPAKLTVAFICTGNRFRSPLAAAALSAEAGAPVSATSAGVLELGRFPPCRRRSRLRALSPRPRLPSSKALSELDLASFDLVLGFERNHVAAAVVDAGARIERTFTLPELVLFSKRFPRAKRNPTLSLGLAPAWRVLTQPASRTAAARVPEVVDPLGRQRREQRKVAEQVSELVRRLTRLLFD